MTDSLDAIIFDFDGVLLESNQIRTDGFRELLGEHAPEHVEAFIRYHEDNGGLSRYHKLRHFYKEMLREDLTDEALMSLCKSYSEIVKQRIVECDWVKGALECLEKNYLAYKLFIVSGSDQNELREICRIRGIEKYVREILGSPIDKETNVNSLISKYKMDPSHILFVGDSINDLNAAQSAGINFIARDSGNCGAWCKDTTVISDLSQLSEHIHSLKTAAGK